MSYSVHLHRYIRKPHNLTKHRVGSGVLDAPSIIEAMDRLLPTMDRELSQNLAMLLKKRGTAVHTGAKVEKITQAGSELTCTFTQKEEQHSIEADGILVAIGRRPNTQGLFGGDFTAEMNKGTGDSRKNRQSTYDGKRKNAYRKRG